MGLNLATIHARFNAGISTVAIDSPTGAEQSVVAQITNEFLNVLSPARRMRVLLWDTARQLQVLSGETIMVQRQMAVRELLVPRGFAQVHSEPSQNHCSSLKMSIPTSLVLLPVQR